MDDGQSIYHKFTEIPDTSTKNVVSQGEKLQAEVSNKAGRVTPYLVRGTPTQIVKTIIETETETSEADLGLLLVLYPCFMQPKQLLDALHGILQQSNSEICNRQISKFLKMWSQRHALDGVELTAEWTSIIEMAQLEQGPGETVHSEVVYNLIKVYVPHLDKSSVENVPDELEAADLKKSIMNKFELEGEHDLVKYQCYSKKDHQNWDIITGDHLAAQFGHNDVILLLKSPVTHLQTERGARMVPKADFKSVSAIPELLNVAAKEVALALSERDSELLKNVTARDYLHSLIGKPHPSLQRLIDTNRKTGHWIESILVKEMMKKQNSQLQKLVARLTTIAAYLKDCRNYNSCLVVLTKLGEMCGQDISPRSSVLLHAALGKVRGYRTLAGLAREPPEPRTPMFAEYVMMLEAKDKPTLPYIEWELAKLNLLVHSAPPVNADGTVNYIQLQDIARTIQLAGNISSDYKNPRLILRQSRHNQFGNKVYDFMQGTSMSLSDSFNKHSDKHEQAKLLKGFDKQLQRRKVHQYLLTSGLLD